MTQTEADQVKKQVDELSKRLEKFEYWNERVQVFTKMITELTTAESERVPYDFSFSTVGSAIARRDRNGEYLLDDWLTTKEPELARELRLFVLNYLNDKLIKANDQLGKL